jgi:cobalt-zinc-cadmium efflux system outer membrane protein
MSRPRLLLVLGLLLGGCTWPVRENTDKLVQDLANHPFDVAPVEPAESKPRTEETAAPATRTAAAGPQEDPIAPPTLDIQTVAYLQADRTPDRPGGGLPKFDLKIPSDLPGSEAPRITFENMTREQRERTIKSIYPELPPLPIPPAALPGPHGKPYTLADLQQLAAVNSPTLRQAASDVEAAKGNLVQARTYQNPTIAYNPTANNNNSNTGARGGYIDQHLTMWGKRPLAVAAAQKDVDNALLALKRARSDLATNVRNAYYNLVVAQETVRVTRALARFTDEVYRLYTGYLQGGFAASYEPAALRSQAYATRLAYQQAITTYEMAWKQLVATLGLCQLPLTEVAGRVDRLIPYYDYDAVLAHVLNHHTDVLTARNAVEKARYNLKLAQITPYPDMDVNAGYWKELTLAPYSSYYGVVLSFPVPIWDQNKGNIMNAQAALIRAIEELHRVENYWTNTIAAAYANYQRNLNALEDYRRYILPDQVRYYRGVFDRRQVDINASPSDLVTAQQALATNVQGYLTILGTLWSAVVSVADPLQTDDLFQCAKPHELPELPPLDNLPHWLCPHGRLAAAPPPPVACGSAAPPGTSPMLPNVQPPQAPAKGPVSLPAIPATPGGLPQRTAKTGPELLPVALTQQLMEPPPTINQQTSSGPNATQPRKEVEQ